MHSTGGLRPPLLALVQRPSTGRTTIFAVHERTFTRAAGVSPPWFGETNAARRKSCTVMRPRDGRARAAGVSPPWFSRHVYADTSAIARKTADSMWADHRCHRVQRHHGGLTPPALGRTCRRRCRWAILADESDTFPTGGLRPPLLALVQRPSTGRTTILRCTSARSTKSGGRQPAVVW